MNQLRRAFSSSVFVIHNRRVLLIKHKLLSVWLPIGGELEFRFHPDKMGSYNDAAVPETPLECAKRELLEETGLVGRFFVGSSSFTGEPVGFIGYEEHLAGPKGLHMNFCFMCFVDTDRIVGDGSFSEHRWFELADVKRLENCPLNVKQCVLKIQDRLVLGGFKD
jgi:ADP-ribose pyrophosphatase YjhB (NUDIX family)